MKNITKTAEVSKAYGEDLAEPIKFPYSYVELEKGDAIPAKEMPDEDGLRSYVNQKRNAAARSAAQTKALEAAGIQKPTLEDQKVQIATMARVLLAAKSASSQDEAEKMAREILGITE